MEAAEAVRLLRAREADLRALGIVQLCIFGSTARGEQREDSDVDLAAVIDYDTVWSLGPWAFFGLEDRVAAMIGVRVDLVTEPRGEAPRLQAQIDRDRVHVF